MRNSFYTDTGMLEILVWILKGILTLGAVYAGYNTMVLLAVMAGAEGVADPFWNAPLYWMFGK